MAGVLILPRDTINMLAAEPDLLALWVYLANRAAYKPCIAPKGTRLTKGQLVTSKAAITKLFGWTESKSRRGLERLRDRTVIELKGSRAGTVVTMCNWDSYRLPPPTEKQSTEPKPNQNRNETEQPGEPKSNLSKRRSLLEDRSRNTNNRSPSTVDGDRLELNWWTPDRISRVRQIASGLVDKIHSKYSQARCTDRRDREMVVKAVAAVVAGWRSEDWLNDAFEGTVQGERVEKPWAYIWKCLANGSAEIDGTKITALFARIDVPEEAVAMPHQPPAPRMCVGGKLGEYL